MESRFSGDITKIREELGVDVPHRPKRPRKSKEVSQSTPSAQTTTNESDTTIKVASASSTQHAPIETTSLLSNEGEKHFCTYCFYNFFPVNSTIVSDVKAPGSSSPSLFTPEDNGSATIARNALPLSSGVNAAAEEPTSNVDTAACVDTSGVSMFFGGAGYTHEGEAARNPITGAF